MAESPQARRETRRLRRGDEREIRSEGKGFSLVEKKPESVSGQEKRKAGPQGTETLRWGRKKAFDSGRDKALSSEEILP